MLPIELAPPLEGLFKGETTPGVFVPSLRTHFPAASMLGSSYSLPLWHLF